MKLWLRTSSLRGGGPFFVLNTPLPVVEAGPEPAVTVIDVYRPWAVKVEDGYATIVDPDWVVTDWIGDAQ